MLLYIAGTLATLSLIILAFNPVHGIALVLISKPFIDTQFEQPILGGLRLTELVAAGVPIVVLIHMVFSGDEKAFSKMPLRWIWLIFIVDVTIFSFLIAYNQDLVAGANVFFRHLNGFVGFYMAQAFFQREKRLKLLLIALMVAGLFPVGVGIYQAATGVVWRQEQTEGIARNIGLWHDSVNIREYAAQSILALLLYGVLYIKRFNVPLKVVTLAYLSLAVMVIAKTYSKAGYLSLAVWAACWTLLRKRYLLFALIAVGGAVAGLYYGSDFLENVQQMFHKEIGFLSGKVAQERTFAGRWYGWREMMAEWQQFGWMSKIFGSGKVALGAHNDYLLFLYQGGIVGLGIYLLLLARVGARIVVDLWRRVDPMSVAALMLLLMWLIDTIGLVPSAYPAYQWFVWGMIGLSFRLRENEMSPQTTPGFRQEAKGKMEGENFPAGEVHAPSTRRRYPLVSYGGIE
jgi:hypothetical protein